MPRTIFVFLQQFKAVSILTVLLTQLSVAEDALSDSSRMENPVSIPDFSGIEKVDHIGNILFWVGQAKFPVLLIFNNKEWNLIPFLTLYAVQETGLGMNFHANRSYLQVFRDMGGEPSFLRDGASKWYFFDKALTLTALSTIVYGITQDKTGPIIIGALGAGMTNLLDFYLWHSMRQNTQEARSAIRNWHAGIGFKEKGGSLTMIYSFQ